MLPDNFGHVIKVEEAFHFCPNILLSFGKVLMLKKFQVVLGICMLPYNFWQIIKVSENIVAAHHSMTTLSSEREYVAERLF